MGMGHLRLVYFCSVMNYLVRVCFGSCGLCSEYKSSFIVIDTFDKILLAIGIYEWNTGNYINRRQNSKC